MKQILFLLVCVFLSAITVAQENNSTSVEPYWDIALSANIWPGENKTIGIQVAGGAIFNKAYAVGFGFGIGSRAYEYYHIPIELGYITLKGNAMARLYGGPTFDTFSNETGFLGGTEFVFRPRFDMRNLKLFIAIGLALDYGDENRVWNSRDPTEKTLVPGPRVRLGLAL